MYVPPHFKEDRPEALHAFMQQHPFASLVTRSPRGLDANHLPFELDAARGPLGTLQAHVARANPVWQAGAAAAEVLVIFRGPQAYVSPSWYPSKHEAHRQVPTWNYEVVHAHGTVRFIDDEKFVRGVVARLTRRHEAGEAVPWKMGDAPRDYLDGMVKLIVGLEIEITRLEGKWKLGQNKEARDRSGAAGNLDRRGEAALAAAMRDTLAPGDR